MDKAAFEARVAKLKDDQQAIRNDYLRLEGAILVLESIIAEWDKPTEETVAAV